MTRLIVVSLLMSAGFISPGLAQPMMTGVLGSPSAYIGPGDISASASAFWGLRGYSVANALAGVKAVNIVRASDSTTADIVILPSGRLDVATATAFCASTTCKVVTLYDQTGHGYNATQGADANRPVFTLNCLNSMPCMTFAGTQNIVSSTAPTVSNPVGISIVAERTGVFTTQTYLFSTHADGTTAGFRNVVSTWSMYAAGPGQVTAAATDSAWHVAEALYASGSSIINIDDLTPGTANAGPNGFGTNFSIGALVASTNGITGNIVEIGAWPVNIGSVQRTGQCHNAYTFWATSVAC